MRLSQIGILYDLDISKAQDISSMFPIVSNNIKSTPASTSHSIVWPYVSSAAEVPGNNSGKYQSSIVVIDPAILTELDTAI